VAPCQFVNGRHFWSAIVASFGTSVLTTTSQLQSSLPLSTDDMIFFCEWARQTLKKKNL
jgi:hypothetical protein